MFVEVMILIEIPIMTAAEPCGFYTIAKCFLSDDKSASTD